MIYAIVAVLVLIADQAVKFWTTKNILLGAVGDDCVELIRGFVHMTNVHNYGAAFSILENARWLLVAVSAIFVIAVIVLMNREIIHTRFGRWTAVLVVAGAIGNCIDRILYGYVVDMFEFEFSLFGKPFSFPVFNVADIFITVAGILFCIHVIFHNEPEAVKAANEPDFIRRRREAREAKEAPYANVPHRGEHKSLEDELRAPDPDDPFAEWSFGDVVAEPAPEPEVQEQSAAEPEPAPAGEEPEASPPEEAPVPVQEMPSTLRDAMTFEPKLPKRRGAPEDQTAPTEAKSGGEEFSLEDILSEFGDI